MRGLRIGVGGAGLVGLAALLAIVWWAGPAGADGTETLGPPSITLADGDDFVGAGVGLFGTEPGGPDPGGSRPVSLTVPVGATVQQVLVYWEGQSSTAGAATDTILVNGTAVTGQLIGGPTDFGRQGPVITQTYRADVTSLGVLAPGPNTVTLGGLDFDRKNSGAGVFAIVDTGTAGTVAMQDGNDFAFNILPSPLDTTTPLTISFPTVATDTVVEPLLFVSSVDNEMPRSSVIRFTFDTGHVVEFGNVLTNTDGDEWDTFRGPVTVPAGASSATVQILSQLPTGQAEGPQPASLVWNLAAASIPAPAQVGGLQVVKTISGATDGYVPGTVFTVAVDCDGTEFDTTFDLTPGGAAGVVTGMPTGTVCSVTETDVPDAAPDFAYGTPTYSPGQTVTITDETTVEVVVDNPLTQASLTLLATPICINDTPYIGYEVQLDQITAPNGATIRFTNASTGEVVQELTNQPLSGRLLWPGAVVDASGETIDWPGWEFVNGEWVEVDDGLRPEIDLTVEVNPEDTVRVEYPPPEPLCNPNPGMVFVATPICINDTPYIDYEAQVFGIAAANGATIRFTNTSTGEVVQELTDQPLSGRLLWPGAVVDASGETIDWPGWEFVNGEWVEVDDGLRPEIDLTVEVNPTSTVRVDYPPPQPLCNPNPLPQQPPDPMPETGSNSVDMSLLGLILMALGGVFVVSGQIVRRIH